MTKLIDETDVLIVGGGPSGLATALAIRRSTDLRVCVVERYSARHQRVGEVLPPAIIEPLSELGLWEKFLAASPTASAGVSVWWGHPNKYDWDYIRVPYGRGWHIDRLAFESMLESAAVAGGVSMLRGWKVTEVMNRCGALSVFARDKSATQATFRATYVIDARGRSFSSVGLLGGRRQIDRLVGLTCYYEAADSSVIEPRLWVEATQNGWWYSAPLPNQCFVASYLTDSDCVAKPISESFQRALEAADETRRRVENLERKSRVLVATAHSGRRDFFSCAGMLAVGDAAFSTDPARGHGLLNALRHALFAATAITEVHAGRLIDFTPYNDCLDRQWADYLDGVGRHYSAETRWASERFWTRRAKGFHSPT